ncbi:hypothetical protein PN836_011895 [Ningiella sp. W23]|uniref:hypothetical protein n=1 Tax=Ningiella sp. W23 TaxID=3023715 RepID=UPI0037572CCC
MAQFYKLLAASIWSTLIFGLAFIFHRLFEKEGTFALFIVAGICVSIAYDGLKTIFKFNPSDKNETKEMFWGAFASVGYLALSLTSLGSGAVLAVYFELPEIVGQVVSFGGFIGFYVLAIMVATGTEKRMKRAKKDN